MRRLANRGCGTLRPGLPRRRVASGGWSAPSTPADAMVVGTLRHHGPTIRSAAAGRSGVAASPNPWTMIAAIGPMNVTRRVQQRWWRARDPQLG